MNVHDDDMRQHPPESVALEADHWLARLRSPQCTAADRARFQDWLARHPMHWQAYNNAERLWTAVAQQPDVELAAMADAVLLRARRRRQASPRRARLLGWVAAVLVMFAGGWGLLLTDWFTPAPPAAIYSTAIGEVRSFTLRDGSVVTLNTDTVLEVHLNKRERMLALQRGEAQFDVAPDPKRPFTVATPQAKVIALGTVFQVRSRSDGTEIALLEGRVRVVATTGDGNKADLAPGERLIATADHAEWRRGRVNRDAANGWLSGRLIFEAIPLREAVDEFNRYSQRKLRIDDPDIGDIPIQGIFNAGDTDSIVLALQYAYPLTADDKGDEIVLRRK